MLVWLAIRVLMSCSGLCELNPLSSTYFNFQLPDIRDCRQLAQRAGLRIGAFDDKAKIQNFGLTSKIGR